MQPKPNPPERERVRAALEAAHGIQEHAAAALGVSRTTLQTWLTRGPLTELREYARQLRVDYAPEAQGRPWTVDEARDRRAVEQAWIASGYRLAVAARLLGVPRSSLRHLLHRYELPNLPAPGRPSDVRRR